VTEGVKIPCVWEVKIIGNIKI